MQVFVYSFAGRSVRVLQCHYDQVGQWFHVRKTPYIHIKGRYDFANIKLILRWMMNKPRGDLKLKDLRPDMRAASDAEPGEQPPTPRKNAVKCRQ